MNAVVRDRDALTALLPLNAAAYLRTHGWQEAHSEAGRYAIWLLNDGERTLEVLLPLNREFDDYAIRVSEMLATLAEAEQRSQSEILQGIATIFFDVIRVRSRHDDEDLGIDGLVTGLQREDGSEGLVTITGLVEGSLRRVKVFLSGSDYDRAIEAHRNRSLVHCEGDLVKEGRHYFLRHLRGFSIEVGQGDSD